jgi:hypothetical protein
LAAWLLEERSPCAALTGLSGIGKTNFLVELLQCVGRTAAPWRSRPFCRCPRARTIRTRRSPPT